jgi:nitric oxide reductase activation protein
VDVFDSKYLIEDARSAVLEARKNAINSFGMVLDAKADAYVKRIFGWLNYRIVDNPKTLPHHLSSLYSRLTSL